MGAHMIRSTTSIAAVATAVLALAMASQASAQVNIADTLDTEDTSATTPERIFRDAIPSTCGSVKAYPGTFGAGGFAYETHTLFNNGPAQCVTITVTSTCGNGAANVHAMVYDGFDPAIISADFLGDIGSSTGNGVPQSMSLDLAAGQSVELVIQSAQNVGSGQGTCPYTVTSAELDETLAPPPPAVVPTLQEWAMILLAGLMAGAGAVFVWRRRSGLA